MSGPDRMASPRFFTLPLRTSPWRLTELIALLATIPAFYMAATLTQRALCLALYLLACAACVAVIVEEARHPVRSGTRTASRLGANMLAGLLAIALFFSAVIPQGEAPPVLGVRLATAILIMLRIGQSAMPKLWRGGLAYLLSIAVTVLGFCGLGFWWLEPSAQTFGDGLWLAFTTAATVGYGDIVPTTAASKVFAVFVVLMGFAALSLVTAAIAAMWVQAEEKRIEDDMLRDLHLQMARLHGEISALRHDLHQSRIPP